MAQGARLGAGAVELVREWFSWDKPAERTIRVLTGIERIVAHCDLIGRPDVPCSFEIS